jgi:hypothetical protein
MYRIILISISFVFFLEHFEERYQVEVLYGGRHPDRQRIKRVRRCASVLLKDLLKDTA